MVISAKYANWSNNSKSSKRVATQHKAPSNGPRLASSSHRRQDRAAAQVSFEPRHEF